MSATQKWSRMRRAASSNIWRHSAVGSTVTTIRRVSTVYSSAPASTGPSVGALDAERSVRSTRSVDAVADDEPGAVAAHRVGADRVGDHVELAAGEVEALQHRLLGLDVGARAAVAQRAVDRQAVPEQAVLRRAHPVVAALDDRDRHHPGGEPLDVDDDLGRPLVLLLFFSAGGSSVSSPGSDGSSAGGSSGLSSSGETGRAVRAGPNGDGVRAPSGTRNGRQEAGKVRSNACSS